MCFDWYIKVYRCVFHCEIVEDAEKVKQEEKAYKKIPIITDFTDEEGNDRMKEMIQEQSHQSRRAANRRRRTGMHQERSGAGAPVTTDVIYKRILAANSARILLYSVIH